MNNEKLVKSISSSSLPVSALMTLGRVYSRGFHHLRVCKPCRLPASGAAILVCNHTSGLDPVLIQSACPRLITWMMAKEFYDVRWLTWGFKRVGAIPVARSGNDLMATRAALRALKDGQVIGIFPEGRIEPTRDLLPFQPGVALLASRSKASVYPAYLDGTQRKESDMLAAFARRQSVSLTFGGPIRWTDNDVKPDLQARTEQIRAAIEALKGSATSLWRGIC